MFLASQSQIKHTYSLEFETTRVDCIVFNKRNMPALRAARNLENLNNNILKKKERKKTSKFY